MSYNFLLTSWGGLGNLGPMLTAAGLLRRRGHVVRVVADLDTREDVEAAGFAFAPWGRAPSHAQLPGASDLTSPSKASDLRGLCDNVLFGPAAAYAADTREECEKASTDALLVHDLLPGAALAAEAAGIPCAMLSPYVSVRPLPGVPPVGSGLLPPRTPEERAEVAAATNRWANFMNEWLPPLNAARADQSLAPLEHVIDLYDRPARVLLAISRAFDFPPNGLPKNVRYIGPLLDPSGWSRPWIAPWPAKNTRPRALVSFSTTFQDQADTLQRVMNALGQMEMDAVVTIGPALDGTALRAPKNVTLLHSAPHDAVMQEVTLVVTHGGHGTVSRALIHGLPLLVMPMGRDQNDNAMRVEVRRVGLTLPPTASESEIAAALRRLVIEPQFRRAASVLGKAIAADLNSSRLVHEMEAIAASGRPRATSRRSLLVRA